MFTMSDRLPINARVVCRICGGGYRYNRNDAEVSAPHLRSRRHRTAAYAAGLPPDAQDPMVARCAVCGGSLAKTFAGHADTRRHREAAKALGLENEDSRPSLLRP
jgi:hypothetical protein